ncbi:hypothetical protein DERF_007812 [Dermatophagoides farinae]|uniref:Uncharacterized protein n=1 Tax=Dermatophagoides farinae TaxID=6954 RepID=A0A922HYZ1_DERFA|nr:hypothetical protein DERF_007812 [Dermatophagoides farinae]
MVFWSSNNKKALTSEWPNVLPLSIRNNLSIQKTGPTFLKFIWFVSDDDYDITTTTQSTRVIYACN